MEAYIKSDKDQEMIFKSTCKEIVKEVARLVGNDHGLVDYLLDLYSQLMVPYKFRLEFLRNMIGAGKASCDQGTQPPKKVQNLLYQKLHDETTRLNEYRMQVQDILVFIRKREDVS